MATLEEREAIRQSLADHRRQLSDAVREVGRAARSWTDLADYVRHAPGAWLVGGFVLGVWLGERRRKG